ncbi:MAG TPA: hypothetical protein VNH17_07765, partial [Streptosporangiaceae bacterium]|nr:hypothetical protein [Streptosporangiaceae bacterium]
DPAAATPGPPRAGRTWRLHLPVREIVATAVAAAGAFVAVLLAVLWLSSRRARSAAAPGRPGPGPEPGRWEARTWSFGPGQADEHGWPPDLPGYRRSGAIGAGGSGGPASRNGMTAAASAGEPKIRRVHAARRQAAVQQHQRLARAVLFVVQGDAVHVGVAHRVILRVRDPSVTRVERRHAAELTG